MECKCGGETRTSEAVLNKLHARLAFYECKSCSRVSSAALFIRGSLVATDPKARTHFASLDQASADALHAETIQPSGTSEPIERFTTGELF